MRSSLLPGRDGLVHISKLGKGKRINKVEDVVNVGSKLRVEIADIDERGKISLVPVDDDKPAEAKADAEGRRLTDQGPMTGRPAILTGMAGRSRCRYVIRSCSAGRCRGRVTCCRVPW